MPIFSVVTDHIGNFLSSVGRTGEVSRGLSGG